MLKNRLLLVALTILGTFPALAGTFIVPKDKVLIDRADAVVVGVVETSEAQLVDERSIYTITEIHVSEVLKGDEILPGQLITLREPGGRTATRSLVLHGVPQYTPGDRVMVMLKHDAQPGLWRTHEYALGKFGFIRDDFDRGFLVRDRENVCGWSPGFRPYREQARKQDEFLDYVRAVALGEDASDDYLVDFENVCIAGGGSELNHAHAALTALAASDYLSLCNCRWNNGATATFQTTGSQTGYTDSRGDASTGMMPWDNHGESNINYTLGGSAGGTQAFKEFDGINTILFDDPAQEVNGAGCFGGSGTLAIGGPWYDAGTTHTFAGESLATTEGVDLVIDCGVNPTNGINQAEFQATIAHELGHTLGFRHSDQLPSGCAGCDLGSTALMAADVNNGPGNASLLAWDQRAAKAAYGSGGGTTCTAVSITSHPQSSSITSGGSANLSVAVAGTGPFTYQWYRGMTEDTSNPVGTNSSSFNTGALTQTTSFWVRVTNCTDKTAASNAATVTVSTSTGCPAGRLCSLNGRFQLGLAARDHRTDKTGNGVPLQQNDLFGFFSLPDFTGNANNPEVFVKMLDGRGINNNFWVFYGGLTDLEYTLTVVDTVAATTKTYFKTGGTSNGGFDVGSGVASESCVGEVDGTPDGSESPSSCGAGSDRLCLNSSRFRVELNARDHRTGNMATGQSIPQADIFGYFSLPGLTGNADNPEVFVKVVDGRPINGFYWVFFSGLTDFEYTLTVIDTSNGQRKTYSKAGGSACGFFDTNAF